MERHCNGWIQSEKSRKEIERILIEQGIASDDHTLIVVSGILTDYDMYRVAWQAMRAREVERANAGGGYRP